MKSVKVVDLKVGMQTEWGQVVEVSPSNGDTIDITFSVLDHDCGETEYYPCSFFIEDQVKAEVAA